MQNTLHITNGDSVAYLWRKGGLLGTYLPWRDVLHEGPVPPGATLEETSNLRAQYLGVSGYGNTIKIQHEFQKRDAVMARCAEFDEIVLWFEHDLFDQLQILQILDYLGVRSLPLGKVQLIQSDDFLGMLAPEELLALQSKRRPVNAATFRLAKEVWDAYRQETPQALYELQDRVTSEMRHLHSAIRRLFEEYPGKATGLSRTQTQILDTVAGGVNRKDDIFRLSQNCEEAVYLGDSSFFRILDDLCAQPAPLLNIAQGRYVVTPLGERVAARERDWLEDRPIDRWIGGVHLAGPDLWRWDGENRCFLR
ncbi:MAG: DUF1835 domain-containing protein [Vulcanimicrobiaceae bacterium]